VSRVWRSLFCLPSRQSLLHKNRQRPGVRTDDGTTPACALDHGAAPCRWRRIRRRRRLRHRHPRWLVSDEDPRAFDHGSRRKSRAQAQLAQRANCRPRGRRGPGVRISVDAANCGPDTSNLCSRGGALTGSTVLFGGIGAGVGAFIKSQRWTPLDTGRPSR
jgi:hypothetical protein